MHDGYSLAVGAVGSGLGALLAASFQGGWPRRQLVIGVSAIVGGMAVAAGMLDSRLTKIQQRRQLRAQASAVLFNPLVVEAFVDESSRVSQSPTFLTWMQTQASKHSSGRVLPEQALATLADVGAARLGDDDFRRMAELKVKLAAFSPVLCADFFSGRVDAKDLFAAIDQLPAADAHAWFALTTRAAELELAQHPPARAIDPHELDRAVAAAASAMGSEQGAWFEEVLAGPHRAESDRCQAFQLLARQAASLPPNTGLVLAMYIAAPQLLTSDAQAEGKSDAE